MKWDWLIFTQENVHINANHLNYMHSYMAIKIIHNIVNMKIIGKTFAKSANNLKPTTEATDKHFLSLML